jgi:alkanesulfonate monooxygenase SsuD/methylene tetrahydromethanopterin reductase-like flavin-dependent oxidoreductase (luciferase family)
LREAWHEIRTIRRARARRGPTGDSHAYHDFVNYVIEAEKLGFSSVFLVEHHFTGFGQVSASMSLLAYLAARTDRIRLGTAVVVLPWHNPILVAEQAATLDLLSNGRLDFGVGKGYRSYEFSGFCIPPEEATERFDEAMEVIRTAWTSPGRFSLSRQALEVRQCRRRAEPDPAAASALLARRRQCRIDPPCRARGLQPLARPDSTHRSDHRPRRHLPPRM